MLTEDIVQRRSRERATGVLPYQEVGSIKTRCDFRDDLALAQGEIDHEDALLPREVEEPAHVGYHGIRHPPVVDLPEFGVVPSDGIGPASHTPYLHVHHNQGTPIRINAGQILSPTLRSDPHPSLAGRLDASLRVCRKEPAVVERIRLALHVLLLADCAAVCRAMVVSLCHRHAGSLTKSPSSRPWGRGTWLPAPRRCRSPVLVCRWATDARSSAPESR